MRQACTTLHVRLNQNNSEQMKALAYLNRRDRKVYPSYNKLIAQAIIEFFEKRQSLNCPCDEKDRELISQCVEAIYSVIQRNIQDTLPAYLAGCYAASGAVSRAVPEANTSTLPETSPAQTAEEHDYMSPDEIDWNFLGEG